MKKAPKGKTGRGRRIRRWILVLLALLLVFAAVTLAWLFLSRGREAAPPAPKATEAALTAETAVTEAPKREENMCRIF